MKNADRRAQCRREACRTVAGLALAGLIALLPRAAAADETVWLCKPGIADNPCETGLETTILSAAGQVRRLRHLRPARHPKVDCFYVYPTVSDQPTANANLDIDPEQRSIALYQAARYSQHCRVFAPMYRQATLAALLGSAPGADRELAYADVLNAWNDYLQTENNGRGVVLIGHSQGTAVLRRLIREQIDPNPAVRQKLVSAILLGGNVTVPEGLDSGGDFQNVPACRSPRQIGCTVAFSTFNEPVPPNSRFGRAAPGFDVLCTNAAALRRGSAPLRSILPSAPFAPGTLIGAATQLVGFAVPAVQTTWIEVDGAYRGTCTSDDDADVLQISAQPGAAALHAVPDATWGLHLIDANIALGNLVRLVRAEARVFVKQRHCQFERGTGWFGCMP